MNNSGTIRITVTGDFFPCLPGQIKDFTGELSQLLDSSDLNITNLESPLTGSINKIRKSGPHLKAAPDSVKYLQQANINLVTLANNHLMDFGVEGFTDTVSLLDSHGIKYTGAGATLDDAGKYTVLEIKGKKVAVINFTHREFSTAEINRPGANPIDIIGNYDQITRAKAESDFQIVIVHAGIEGYQYPTPKLQKLFRFYANLGVGVVIGHHSHCISGFEIHQGVPVYYSLGNFVFPEHGQKESWYRGLLLEITIDKNDKVLFTPHSFRQIFQDKQLTLKLTENEIPEKLDDKIVSAKWQEYIRCFPKMRNTLNYLQRRNLFGRVLNKMFPRLMYKGFGLPYLNLLRNETNYEYVIDMLQVILKGKR